MFGRSKNVLGDLKANVLDERKPLSTVLRQAKVLAAGLRHAPLKTWLTNELEGYGGSGEELPEYRRIATPSLGTFSGPFGSRVDNVVLPTASLPDDLAEFAETTQLFNSVREIEDMASSAGRKDSLRHRWPAEAVMYARNYVAMDNGCVLVDAWKPITKYVLEGILDSVRNKLLDFLLELEQVEPEIFSSSEAVARVDQAEVSQIFNYTITGDNNVVAAGQQVTQTTQFSVSEGDTPGLASRLDQIGIPSDEQQKLIEALESDGSSEQKELGPATQSWLGRATQKMAEGAWKTTTTAAPQLVVKAISEYLGW